MEEHRVRIVNVRLRTNWRPDISDHAILRYLERVSGVDVDAIRQSLSTHVVRWAVVMGARSVVIPEGGKLVLNDRGRVVTILGNVQIKARRRGHVKRPSRAVRQRQEAAE